MLHYRTHLSCSICSLLSSLSLQNVGGWRASRVSLAAATGAHKILTDLGHFWCFKERLLMPGFGYGLWCEAAHEKSMSPGLRGMAHGLSPLK